MARAARFTQQTYQESAWQAANDAVSFWRPRLVYSVEGADAPTRLERGVEPHLVTFHRGYMRANAKQFEKALGLFRRAVELEPNFTAAHYNIGVALVETGRLPDAIAAFRKASELKSDFAEAHQNIGWALAETGQLPDAIAALRKAIELKPDYALAHYNLGVTLAATGQLPDAIASFRKAIEIRPDYAEVHSNLGAALAATGQLPDAIAAYRTAIEINADYAEAHSNLGVALARIGQLPDAVASFRKAIEIRPDYFGVHSNLGMALARIGQFPDAIAAHRKAIEIGPEDATAHYNFGVALAGAGQFPDAIAAFRKASELNRNNPLAHYNLGVALADTGQLSDAIAAFREASRLEPDNAEYRDALGEAEDRGINQQKDELVSRETGYTGDTMDEAARIQTAAELLSTVYPAEAVDKALRDLAANTARETTGRATGKPRPEAATAPASTAPRRVTADELFEGIPPEQQAKRRQKYDFAPELLSDPVAIGKAEGIANARTYKRRKGIAMTPTEDARGKMAESLVKKAKSQLRNTHPSAG